MTLPQPGSLWSSQGNGFWLPLQPASDHRYSRRFVMNGETALLLGNKPIDCDRKTEIWHHVLLSDGQTGWIWSGDWQWRFKPL